MRKLTKIEQVKADALGDAALFHVTGTILNKNIQDCNAAIRDLLKREGVIDYDTLNAGDVMALIIRGGKVMIQNVTKGVAVAVFAIPALDTVAQMSF